MNPKVAIIILNWNGWKDTIECLESLYQITFPDYDVIVMDNGSKDESLEKIKEYCEGEVKVESKFYEYDPSNKPIKIIEYTREEAEAGGGKEKEIVDLPSNKKLMIIKNEKNSGFAEGNNIGMRYVLKALNPDYILLLNNDTVVDPEFLGELVKVAESDERIGIVGPKIYNYDFDGRSDIIWFAGGKVDISRGQPSHMGFNEKDSDMYNSIREFDFITGCAFLVNTSVIEKTGLLNPIFFAGFEDIDWSIRVHENGYKLLFAPSSRIWHKISASQGHMSPLNIYLKTRNRILFVANYCDLSVLVTKFLPYFLRVYFLSPLIRFTIDGKMKNIKALLFGLLHGMQYIVTKEARLHGKF